MVSIRSDLDSQRLDWRSLSAPFLAALSPAIGRARTIRCHFLGRLRRLLWIGLCLGGWVAQAAGTNDVLDSWLTAQSSLGAWTADFVQTRSLNVLSQPLVATGKVWVAGPSEFRWELDPPAQTLVVRQPDQLLVIYPRLKHVEKYALNTVPSGPVKDALALLDASFPRDRATVESRFRVLSAVATNSVLEVTLQPKSASARKFVGEIMIGLRTNDFSLATTEMRFADGSRLRNDFNNVAVRQSIPPERFAFRPPPDFTVIEPLRP
jgi:outer membrane lipoprotein-sorting protein